MALKIHSLACTLFIVLTLTLTGCSAVLVTKHKLPFSKAEIYESTKPITIRVYSACKIGSNISVADFTQLKHAKEIIDKHLSKNSYKIESFTKNQEEFETEKMLQDKIETTSVENSIDLIHRCANDETFSESLLYGLAAAGTLGIFGITPYFRDIHSKIETRVRVGSVTSTKTVLNESREWKWLGLAFYDDSKIIGIGDISKISSFGLTKSFYYTLELALDSALGEYIKALE